MIAATALYLFLAQQEEVEIPIPPVGARKVAGPDALPAKTGMPDVLVFNNGTRVRTREQWAKRRVEIRQTLEDYAVGHMPPAPGNVKGSAVQPPQTVLDGVATYRLIALTFGPSHKLSLNIGIFAPATPGAHPAILYQSVTPPGAAALPRQPLGPNQGKGKNVLTMVGPGPTPVTPPTPAAQTADAAAKRFATALSRGYAVVVFNPNDCAEDTTLRNADGSWAFRNTRFFPAYPDYDWGVLAAWAWGVSRVADYLETDPSIDKSKLIVTGVSRNGKSAMVAAAFDDRLMGAPVVTGGGGVGAYRFAGPRNSETLDLMETKYPNWFGPALHAFRGHREKLPFDEHWFLALCAPRPFVALEGITDTISLPEAVRQSILGATPAYDLFGARGALGVHYSQHGHAFTEEDWVAMLDFADAHLFGKGVTQEFHRFPSEQELDAALAASRAQKKR